MCLCVGVSGHTASHQPAEATKGAHPRAGGGLGFMAVALTFTLAENTLEEMTVNSASDFTCAAYLTYCITVKVSKSLLMLCKPPPQKNGK